MERRTVHDRHALHDLRVQAHVFGKHSTGKGCLYIKRLSDVDGKVLEQLIVKGVKAMAAQRIM